MTRFIPILIVGLFFVGCVTTPKGTGIKTDTGVWQGKAQMINLKTNRKKWVYVTWASDSSHDRMRVDVRALMDVPIATFIKRNSDNQLWLHTEGKHYQSDDGQELFSKLVRFPLNPDQFFGFLGKPGELGGDWTCNDNKQQYDCYSPTHKVHLTIDHEEADRRKIALKKDSKALKIRLIRAKVQVEDRLFDPLPTSQYKTFKL